MNRLPRVLVRYALVGLLAAPLATVADPLQGDSAGGGAERGIVHRVGAAAAQRVLTWQRALYGAVSGRLVRGRSDSQGAALLLISLALGAVHALTPGHGKTVLATYLLGRGLSPARSIGLGVFTAGVHIASTVVLIGAVYWVLDRAVGLGIDRPTFFPVASNGLIVLMGAWLALRGGLGLRGALAGRPRDRIVGAAASGGPSHVGVGVAAGLVPCPLTAVIVLYSLREDLPFAAAAIVVGMLGGVALTLGSISFAAVLARERLMATLRRYPRAVVIASCCLAILAGLAIVALGIGSLISLVTLD